MGSSESKNNKLSLENINSKYIPTLVDEIDKVKILKNKKISVKIK
jgi:hypothetical protein